MFKMFLKFSVLFFCSAFSGYSFSEVLFHSDSEEKAKLDLMEYVKSEAFSIGLVSEQSSNKDIYAAGFCYLYKCPWIDVHEKNIDKAFRYIMTSINNGVYDGYYDLGFMYMKGIYFEKDFKSAIDEMVKGGNYGDVRAQNFLGRVYAGEGHFVTEDDEASFSWFMKAAEKGDEYAMSKISYYYYSGFGVSKDENMAFLWAKKIEGLEEPNIILFAPKLSLFYEKGIRNT
ncbi:hypothetical protein BFW38_05850 [Terasakiispira papahanaumokuakeensis]|uniref:Sel1 repeat family protein n=1 Tax=Terasakiispira papahanaumokuakeensis TaxID=197479 RepID=A0A1E2V7Z6_9GAMM|nr:tetratricopeptide repeat protein [Terasakiispira papahanaumokuakeensis]ODC03138.1 hypothetical protein BFW38_05850 [Terasakiispira papahanaumokuakeensis]